MTGVAYNQIAWKIIKWNSVHAMTITKSNSKSAEANNADGIAINTVSRGSGVSPAGLAQHPGQLPEVNENDNGGGNKHPAEAGHG